MDEHDSEEMESPVSDDASSPDANLAEALERIAKLEAELSGKGGEVEALRAARARDAAALAARDQEHAEFEALRKHCDEVETQLSIQRTRGDELASLLATERSWADEVERLLKDARARGDRLERELADERYLAAAQQADEPAEPAESDTAVEVDTDTEAEAATAASEDPTPEPQPSAVGADSSEPLPDAGGAPDAIGPTAASGLPRWSHGAQLTLTAGQAGCQSWNSVLTETVRIVGVEGRWDAVFAWALDERDTRYTCRAAWCRAPDEMARFETSMWQVRQAATGSPIADAAVAAEPVWQRGFDAEPDPHLSSAVRAGMKTLALVPVREGGETLAVIELWARAEIEPDPELSIALQVIAAGLANVHELMTADRMPRWFGGRYRL